MRIWSNKIVRLSALGAVGLLLVWALVDKDFPHLRPQIVQSIPADDTALVEASAHRVNNGAGGYLGDVRPLPSKRFLVYGPFTDAKMTIATTTRRWHPKGVSSAAGAATTLWSIRSAPSAAETLEFDFRIVAFDDDSMPSGQRDLPLAHLTVQSSPRGNLGNRTLAFPAFASVGIGKFPEAAARRMRDVLFSLPLSFEALPMQTGMRALSDDALLPLMSNLTGVYLFRSGSQSPGRSGTRRIRILEGGAEPIGLTAIRGREAALLGLRMRWHERSEGNFPPYPETNIDLAGFLAVDLATGIVADGYIHLQYEIRRGERLLERYFATAAVTTAF